MRTDVCAHTYKMTTTAPTQIFFLTGFTVQQHISTETMLGIKANLDCFCVLFAQRITPINRTVPQKPLGSVLLQFMCLCLVLVGLCGACMHFITHQHADFAEWCAYVEHGSPHICWNEFGCIVVHECVCMYVCMYLFWSNLCGRDWIK